VFEISPDNGETGQVPADAEDPKVKELQIEIDRLTKEIEREKANATRESEIAKAKADAELKAAKAQSDLNTHYANKELALIKSQKDAITELLPKNETKGLEGGITAGEGFGYLAEQVAYHSLDAISSQITNTISENYVKKAKVLIINDLNIAQADLPWFELHSQFKFFQQISEELEKRIHDHVGEYGKLMKRRDEAKVKDTASGIKASPPCQEAQKEAAVKMALAAPLIAGALSAAPGVAGTLASLAGYFKTDYAIQARNFTMSDNAIISAVAGKLGAKYTNAVYILNAYLLDDTDFENSDVMIKLTELHKRSHNLKNQIAQLSIQVTKEKAVLTQLKQELDDLTGKKARADELVTKELISEISHKQCDISNAETWLLTAEGLTKEEGVVNTELDTFMKNFTTQVSGQNFSKFALAILSEKIKKRLDITHFLYVDIISQGGEAITMKKVFGPSGNTGYIGGVVVTFVFMEKTGKIIASGTYPAVNSITYNLSGTKESEIRTITLKK